MTEGEVMGPSIIRTGSPGTILRSVKMRSATRRTMTTPCDRRRRKKSSAKIMNEPSSDQLGLAKIDRTVRKKVDAFHVLRHSMEIHGGKQRKTWDFLGDRRERLGLEDLEPLIGRGRVALLVPYGVHFRIVHAADQRGLGVPVRAQHEIRLRRSRDPSHVTHVTRSLAVAAAVDRLLPGGRFEDRKFHIEALLAQHCSDELAVFLGLGIESDRSDVFELR